MSLAIMTLVALMRTASASPTLTPNSFKAYTVTIAVTTLPPPMSTFTLAITMPSFTPTTLPFKIFLVLTFIASTSLWSYSVCQKFIPFGGFQIPLNPPGSKGDFICNSL
jgi:hypothetical protein